MKNFNTLKIVTAIALALGFASAQAATTIVASGGTLAVGTTVSASCSAFTIAGGLAFGPYANNNPTPVDATNTVTATCTSGTPYTMAIDPGLNYGGAGGGYAAFRALSNGTGGYLAYAVTMDTPAGAWWGNGVIPALGAVRSATGTGAPQTFTFAGRIPAFQPAPLGAYGDTLVASLTY